MRCAVHIHTTYSDGTATVPEVLEVARELGIEAVLITDHDTLEAKRAGWEGWHDGVLCVVGLEVSPKGGHLLAFGIDQAITHRGRTEPEICEAVRAAGGVSFAAHPFSEGSRISTRIGRPHPWRALVECEGTGIELWSLLTDEAERWRSPRQAVSFVRDPRSVLTGPPEDNLALWDALGLRRRVPAFGGLDAHQPGVRIRGRPLSPMPHDRFLGLLSTHALVPPPTGSSATDGERLIGALAAGRSYLALDWVAPAAGFELWAESAAERLEMGDEAEADGWTMRVRSPRPASLRLLRDGRQVAERTGTELDQPAPQAGVWRAEAWLERGGLPRRWIVSNAIYLRPGAGVSAA